MNLILSICRANWQKFMITGVLGLLAGCSTAPKQVQMDIVYPPPPEPPRFYYETTIRSSADVTRSADTGLSLKEILTGSKGNGRVDLVLAKPFAVEARNGRVFVTDTVLRNLLVFDVANGEFLQIGAEEPGRLRKPLGVATSEDGRIFVADGTNNRVVVYDKSGIYIDAFGGKDVFERIGGLAVTADASRLYVIDVGGVDSDKHVVRIFDGNSGEYLGHFGKRGSLPGEFNLPRDIEIGPDGLLYVSDGANFRVQVFKSDGTFVREWGQVGRTFGSFSRPKGIAVDRDGNVYVADASFGNFQIFNSEGQLLLFIGERSNDGGPGQYLLPAGIAVDEDGRVYFVDQYFKKIDIFRPADMPKGTGRLYEPRQTSKEEKTKSAE